MPEDPLQLLCIEPRFPGHLGAVADWLVRRRGYRCRFYCHIAEARACWPESVGRGLEVVQFIVGGVARESSVAWTRHLERGLCYAFGCWEVLDARRPRPIDLVLGRSAGLGSTLFTPVSLPRVPIVQQVDYFYHPHRHDLAGEAGPDTPADYFHWRRAANATTLLELESGAIPWATTAWQRDLFPTEYRADFLVLYDGVDTRRLSPRPGKRTIAGQPVPPGMRVVSFVARCLDRLRGFDRFVHLANRLLRARPDVLCVAAGAAVVERGLDVTFYGSDYPAHVLGEAPLHDPQRFRLLGRTPPETVAELLAASDLHVYPSRVYLVSRSLVEAMAHGAVVLAWDSAPVREFLEGGRTGLLAPPDEMETAERLALAVLADPAAHRPLGDAAAEWVRQHCSQDVLLPQLARRFDQLRSGRALSMRVLFVHRAFPAQFGRLALELTRRYGWDCTFFVQHLSRCPAPSPEMLERVTLHRLPAGRSPSEGELPWPQKHGEALELGRALFEAVRALPDLRPDLIVGHGGLVPTLFLREALDCPIVDYCEYYFAPHHRDLSYRVELPDVEPAPFYPRCINAATLLNLAAADAAYTPTQWQRQSFPARFHNKIAVHFDGIDTELYRPRRVPRMVAGQAVPADTRIVTYAARGLESVRGFDLFLEVARLIQRRRSDVLFVVAGDERVYYGWDGLRTGGASFKEWALRRGAYDVSRFVFLGHVAPEALAEVLCLSDLHVYLTVPFVLSWSLLNALACGCVVLASDVPPVREVIEPGRNGLVEPLFDVERLAETALRVLENPEGFRPLGAAARSLMEEHYSLDTAVPVLKGFFERTARENAGA